MTYKTWLIVFVVINAIGFSILAIVNKFWHAPKDDYQEIKVKTVTPKPLLVHRQKVVSVKPTCPYRSRPLNRDSKLLKKWKKLTAANFEVYLQSAYLDERTLAGKYPWVRMPGVSIGTTEGTEAWCHFWVDSITIPMISRANIYRVHKIGVEMQSNISSIVLSCQLRPYMPLPDHVSVTLSSSCEPYTNYIQLIAHDDPGSEACAIDFGLCSSTQWIDFQDKSFIEWVEFYKVMGVRQISLYTIDFKIEHSIVDQYKNESFLEVIEVELPDNISKELTFDISSLLKNFALNDCLYKNIYRYCHIVLVNLDEFVVPRNGYKDLSVLINELNKMYYVKPSEVSYKFFNNFFFVNVKDKSHQRLLKTDSNFMRTEPQHSIYGARSVIRITFCLAFHNFHCVSSLADFHGELGVKVNPEVVSLHIYRQCDEFLHNEPCLYKNTFTVEDKTMLTYFDNLTLAVSQK